MSAYLVDPEKIAYLAGYAVELCQYGPTHGNLLTSNAERIAEVLALANIKSVEARYGKGREWDYNSPSEFFDCTYGEYVNDCEGLAGDELPGLFGDADIISIVREYDYQACEFDGYHESLAYTILCQIMWKIASNAHPRGGYA